MSQLIKDMPQNLRPREKMLKHGASSLSNAELLALFLRTGIPGTSAIQVAQNLVDRISGLQRLGSMRASDLAKQPGIGPAKACQIVAAFELGARTAREAHAATPLLHPQQFYDFIAPQISHLRHETVHVMTLDVRMCVISCQQISQGTSDQAMCEVRDVIALPLADGARRFAIAHNHPSGNPDPSTADHRITHHILRSAQLMGLDFIDHFVIGRAINGASPFFSYAESGLLETLRKQVERELYHQQSLAADDFDAL